jgi:hypothetical protein
MPRTRDDILEEQRRLKEEYRHLYDEVLSLLFRHDPVGINFDHNTDEYAPEVGTILPRLRSCASEDDVARVVYEEFTRWFGEPGSRQRYDPIASEIWQLWQRFNAAEPGAGGT